MENLLYLALINTESLTKLLGKNRIFPTFTADITQPSLIYRFKPLKHNLENSLNLELTIIWSDYSLVQEIISVLNNLLHFGYPIIYKQLSNYLFNSLNIGGNAIIWNAQFKMWEQTITFKITYKEI